MLHSKILQILSHLILYKETVIEAMTNPDGMLKSRDITLPTV